MANADYLPKKDQDLEAWLVNASALITSAPTSYGLVAGDATALATLVTAFTTSLALATNPTTRTAVTVANKDVAKNNVVDDVRILVRKIQATTTVTPGQKTALAITVRDEFPSPIGPPTAKPIANIEVIGNLSQTMRIRSEATPTSNAKEFGVIGYEVWCAVRAQGAGEPITIADCAYKGMATRVPHIVSFDAADVGKVAWYIIRAINARAETGPQSDQISATIAA